MRLPESLFAARTMQALELLALQPLSAPQVAEALQVHPRTARRLLTRLADDGWLARSEDARRVYAPTLRIVALASQVLARCRLADTALPYVERLNGALGSPVHLMVPSYRWVLCIAHADGRASTGLREIAPCDSTAAGRALLAHRDAWREDVIGDEPQPELEAIRERGWAVQGRAVAVPVFARGEAVAALAVDAGDPEPVVEAARALERVLDG